MLENSWESPRYQWLTLVTPLDKDTVMKNQIYSKVFMISSITSVYHLNLNDRWRAITQNKKGCFVTEHWQMYIYNILPNCFLKVIMKMNKKKESNQEDK